VGGEKIVKDNFSNQADLYAKYRPSYPQSLIQEIFSHCKERQLAWDCACGNGQISAMLSDTFEKVFASDISQKQIDHAIQKPNISYRIEKAENSSLKDTSIDLIIVAQAIHWFHFDEFYKEVRRVLKPNGLVAVLGYGLFTSIPEVDEIIQRFYVEVVGDYWDPERRYLDEKYESIPFPFNEIKTEKHYTKLKWSVDDILGYINTWSAIQNYINKNGNNPSSMIEADLIKAFNGASKIEISIEIFTKVGAK
jgi:SAM-dependent methyltransferase